QSLICRNNQTEIATEVRIVGKNDYTGRVEIKNYGYWGGVSRFITGNLYKVVCRQLGFNPKNAYRIIPPEDYRRFTTRKSTFFKKIFNCTGKEMTIKECKQSMAETDGKTFMFDAKNDLQVTCNLQLRLVETKPKSRIGRVEVLHDGKWNSICRGLEPRGAVEVCKKLGMNWKFAQPINNIKNLTKNKHSLNLEFVRCDTYYYDVCLISKSESCRYLESGVSCRSKLISDPKPRDEIRLNRGSFGVLEVKDSFSGRWFRVCGTNWTTGAS
ncbi:unnamed protein product, partial [Owenia fusiformis]